MSQGMIPDYKGKKILVTGGGGSGMGAAAVSALIDCGAEVHVLDVRAPSREGASFISVDLKDPEAIEAAVAEIGGGLDALFNCVGVAGNRTSDLDTFLINFVGVRHLTDIAMDYLKDGGAIATISSNAGENWRKNADGYAELVARNSFQDAIDWFESNQHLLEPRVPTSAYRVSKQAVAAWGVLTAAERGQRGIRQNTIMPGFTETPMGTDFREVLDEGYFATYPQPLGRYLAPTEPAKALLFLNSDLASGLTGVTLTVDGGAAAALETRSFVQTPGV